MRDLRAASSFSAVWTPIFATIYAFCNVFRIEIVAFGSYVWQLRNSRNIMPRKWRKSFHFLSRRDSKLIIDEAPIKIERRLSSFRRHMLPTAAATSSFSAIWTPIFGNRYACRSVFQIELVTFGCLATEQKSWGALFTRRGSDNIERWLSSWIKEKNNIKNISSTYVANGRPL